jgi:hypothetical protein
MGLIVIKLSIKRLQAAWLLTSLLLTQLHVTPERCSDFPLFTLRTVSENLSAHPWDALLSRFESLLPHVQARLTFGEMWLPILH